jgi:hypothetical protein
MEKRDRLLYQYKNSSNFKNFLDALFDIVESCSPINLINYLDIDSAVGEWLTQLARMFNVPRHYTAVGSSFILDSSQLDSTEYLDGGGSPIGDIALRALLKAKVLSNVADVKSVEYIYTVFDSAISPVDIEIVEGTKSLTINLDFVNNSEPHRKYLAVTSIDNKWFGCPASTSVTYNVTLV